MTASRELEQKQAHAQQGAPAGGEAAIERTRGCRTVAFASGKGGVGKTVLAAGVGIYLAQLDKRVVLIDAAFGSANLHTLIDAPGPGDELQRFFSDEEADLADLLAPTSFAGLSLLSSRGNRWDAAEPSTEQIARLVCRARDIDAHYMIYDLGSGGCVRQLELFLQADLPIVVTEPEPTAIESTFRWLKSAFALKLQQVGLQGLLEQAQDEAHCGIPSPKAVRQWALKSDPSAHERVCALAEGFRPLLLVNNIRRREDLDLGPALALLSRRHLGIDLDYLGHAEHDDLVWVSLSKRRPLLVEHPEAKVSRNMERLARRVLAGGAEDRGGSQGVAGATENQAEETHYEVLGLHATASEEEVRQAYRRVKRMYEGDAALIHGIVTADEARQFLERVVLAHGTLVDPDKQLAYNQEIFPDSPVDRGTPDKVERGLQTATQLTPEGAASREMPPIDGQTCFTGELIREIRQARGVPLKEVADRTKISVTYLRAIEDEDYSSAPARVYLRGFVKSVAKYLKLDPERVSTSYIERYDAAAR